MPINARASAANLCYHILDRACDFHEDSDLQALVDLLSEANLRNPMRPLSYCLMPNHFHLTLWPLGEERSSGRASHRTKNTL
jgi:putative transposase